MAKKNPIPKNYVRVDTNRYYVSHLKQPRGGGWWMFQIGKGGEEKSFGTHSYGVAKQKAINYAAEKGISHVIVLP